MVTIAGGRKSDQGLSEKFMANSILLDSLKLFHCYLYNVI